MKLLLGALALIVAALPAYAEKCIGAGAERGEHSILLPRSDPSPFRSIFPSIRSANVPDKPATASLFIGGEDCLAPDLADRKRKVEALIGQRVELILDNRDYVVKPLTSGKVDIRALKRIFPTLRLRADKYGEDAEILFVGAEDMNALDMKERLAKVERLVGKPVYARLARNSQ